MKSTLNKFALSFIFLFGVKFSSYSQAVNIDDSLALVKLYNNTNGVSWNNDDNWLTGPVKNWYGITIGNGRVTQISLSGNNVSGNIPIELQKLSSLQYLGLAFNQLTGNIPSELGNIESLINLDLSSNQLTGNIPTELGNLLNLTSLNLSSNQLSGNIPAQLGNLVKLQTLSLSANKLNGSIPPELGNLVKLLFFYLHKNQLSGSIPPELGNLTNLQYLYLSENQLSGSIPSQLGNLVKLVDLYLSVNKLSGVIPPQLGNLVNLIKLNLFNNKLSGSVPSDLGNLSKLKNLYLNDNQFTFDGMELIAQKFPFAIYHPQSVIPLTQNENVVSVSAGGTLTNDTFHLYKDDSLVNTQLGDSAFTITTSGKYYITVTNNIATKLTLYSDMINIETLPITLSSISATKKQNSVLLNWETASESNNSYFAVERSNNNSNFKELAKVNSKGNSTQIQQYSFEDYLPLTGTNYYRLRQVNKDGSSTTSKTVLIDFSKAAIIKIYPNPVKNIITIEGLTGKKTTISIIDLNGRVLTTTSTNDATYTWNIKTLPQGTYYLRTEADKKINTVKFVKE